VPLSELTAVLTLCAGKQPRSSRAQTNCLTALQA
jgi:hypothetical protein